MNIFSIEHSPIRSLGQWVLNAIEEMGRAFIFFLEGMLLIFSWPFRVWRILEQIHFIGAKSILVIALTGIFTGMVLGLQAYHALVQVGSEGMLGTLVALSLIREMGPVLTAFMVIGRAGSAMAAEIGIMRISEQIDALVTMNVNPIRFLISPRLLAGLISFPLLTALFDAIGIVGGYLSGSLLLGTSGGIYWSKVASAIDLDDVAGGFIKAVFFGLLVVTICCYQGFHTHTRKDGFGAKGVSMSTTTAVVMSCVLVLVLNYVLTSFLL
jgi:phospholipid/cholesterol/gamma-HCH transport system permease protein